jgi:hypothetical protein
VVEPVGAERAQQVRTGRDLALDWRAVAVDVALVVSERSTVAAAAAATAATAPTVAAAATGGVASAAVEDDDGPRISTAYRAERDKGARDCDPHVDDL